MFQSAYQDGDCVEVLSAAGKNPAGQWKLSGKVVRLYEKGVKGYVLHVSGGANSKMQLPKTAKGLLALRQRHLVLQVLTATSQDKPFSFELGLTDTDGTRRRLVLSSSFRALHCTPLHAQIPLVGLDKHRGSWANLSIDLVGLTAACFRSKAFRTLDFLALGPTCKLRKVFTMKEALDETLGEAGDGSARDDRTDVATAPGPENSEGCDPVAVAAVPLRMAFPSGVTPVPRNWVISVSTLQRLTGTDVPPPSPFRRNSSAAASSGRVKKLLSKPSPPPSSFERSPPSHLSGSSSLYVPGGKTRVRSSTSEEAERGNSSPRLLDMGGGKRSSSSSSRLSPAGLIPRPGSVASRGSSRSSARPCTAPSPKATPRRGVTAGAPNASSPHRSGVPSSSPSPNIDTKRLSTPDPDTGRDRIGAGPIAMREDTARSGENGTGGVSLLRRSSPQAATKPGSTLDHKANCNQVEGKGEWSLLPARRRASKARMYACSTLEAEQDRVAHSFAIQTDSRRVVHSTRTSEQEMRTSDSRDEGQPTSAPAWSLFASDKGNGSCPAGTFEMPTPQLKEFCSPGSPPDSSPTAVPEPRLTSSHGGRALASTAAHAQELSVSSHNGEERRASAATSSSEALPADIDVSWRGNQYGDDGTTCSAGRSATVSRQRLFGTEKKAMGTSSRSRSLSSTATSAIALDFNPSIPTTLGASARCSPAAPVFGRENQSLMKTSATGDHLFGSPLSTVGDNDLAARRSSVTHESGTNNGVTISRSPMSARVDILQNLLAPAVVGGQDLTHKCASVLKPGTSNADEVHVASAAAEAAMEARGDRESNAVPCGDTFDNDDALERLLRRSPIADGSTGNALGDSSISSDIDAVSGFVDTIAGLAICPPGNSVSRSSSSPQQVAGIDRSGTAGLSRTTLRPTPSKERLVGVATGTRPLDLRHGCGGGTNPISDDNEDEATMTKLGGGEGRDSDDCAEIGPMKLPSHVARSEGDREKRDTGSRIAPNGGLDVVEELERKELDLFDLEESFHTEFGSIELSESPGQCSSFTENFATAGRLYALEKTDTNPSKIPKLHLSELGGGKPGITPPTESSSFRQRVRVYHARNDGGDTDSVVLGSRDSTTSAAPGEKASGDSTCGRERSPTVRVGRIAQEGMRDRGDGHDSTQTAGGNGELYFDPVLNCYYDRSADKYYGLR